MKSKADELDVDKLKPVSTDLKAISNVEDNDVVKKTVYCKWLKMVIPLKLVYLAKNRLW